MTAARERTAPHGHRDPHQDTAPDDEAGEGVRWTSPSAVPESQRQAFDELLPYCVPPGGHRCEHTDLATVVHYRPTADWPAARAEHLLAAAHARTARRQGAPRARFEQVATPAPTRPAPAGHRRVGTGLEVGPGASARLLRALDTVLLDLALDSGADEYTAPHLVDWSTVERAGYTRSFPQNLLAAAEVGPDLAALDRFAAAPDRAARRAELVPGGAVLAPAVCLHLFAALADRPLPAPVRATARAGCARRELPSAASATRLTAFTMREIVYVGDAAGARAFRDDMLERLESLARAVGLPCRLETANDPFFTPDRVDYLAFQSAYEVKHELRARLPHGAPDVAVASVNLHQQHFGTGFGIDGPDGAAYSACIGFGLERWAHWIRAHTGDDPADWPAPLREAAAARREPA
ncbi:class-II aminoacyl-tRNA synthetase family protein [Kitasatospora indigofera]|uniref:hypothetical protein n=1 Tax=Kitasatospora indigofera TaxID=67307 RepID=UPI0036C1453E